MEQILLNSATFQLFEEAMASKITFPEKQPLKY